MGRSPLVNNNIRNGQSYHYLSNAYGHELSDSYFKLLILANTYLPGEVYELKRPYNRYSRHLVTEEQYNYRFQTLAGIGRCGRILSVAGHMTY